MEHVPLDEDKYVTMFLGFPKLFWCVCGVIPESIRVQAILG